MIYRRKQRRRWKYKMISVQERQQLARLSDSKQELNQILQEVEASTQSAIVKAEEAETRVKKIEERLTKTKIARWLDAKDKAIQRLKRKLVQQQEEKR